MTKTPTGSRPIVSIGIYKEDSAGTSAMWAMMWALGNWIKQTQAKPSPQALINLMLGEGPVPKPLLGVVGGLRD